MRTTITLDQDVVEQAKGVMADSGQPFKQVVNEAMRRGLEQMRQTPAPRRYRTKPQRMGLRPGYQIDNIQDLLAQVEGEQSR